MKLSFTPPTTPRPGPARGPLNGRDPPPTRPHAAIFSQSPLRPRPGPDLSPAHRPKVSVCVCVCPIPPLVKS